MTKFQAEMLHAIARIVDTMFDDLEEVNGGRKTGYWWFAFALKDRELVFIIYDQCVAVQTWTYDELEKVESVKGLTEIGAINNAIKYLLKGEESC